ncbi:DDE superfamily endonuclease domain-containing protein [Hirsutella rhossiliensis]|uniref:DDE superfamily endonuclease domain-containing protein n=1 Tax=Hirsutella rhossiliensis TaxID=111463 RepID=A0A9P8MM73_9HYPO|nr:DDE superfamily endonuclease domain-containing protein [Hirsutella rhossiliensis]KAH0957715.1 DDE superfamily endonuclease domain-containing protein [Hirsutella rhossiliensis]
MRLKAALDHVERFPDSKLAKVARDFDVPRLRLRRRLEGRGPRNGNPEFHTKLTKAEETALCRYIDRLDNINLAVRKEFVQDTANCILKRHGYNLFPSKVLDANRQASEDVEMLNEYFQKLRTVIEANGIVSEDIWNMDETGFQIGVESATAIEAVSAGGKVIPLFLILSGQMHMSQWYQVKELEGDTVIGTSPTGYSNDRHSLSWLKHFDHHSRKETVGSKRLLLMDGYSSHTTKEFIQYCDDHDIIPFGYPPHSTHLVQPLDVVVFQPYKHYHAKALDLVVRDGVTNITKLEFLALIQGVRSLTFTKTTIQAAFRETVDTTQPCSKRTTFVAVPHACHLETNEQANRSTPSEHEE